MLQQHVGALKQSGKWNYQKMHKALNLFHCNSKVKVCVHGDCGGIFNLYLAKFCFAHLQWESVNATQSNL